VKRRDCQGWAAKANLAGLWPACSPTWSFAGGQLEELLADSVRMALRAAIDLASPAEPAFPHTEAKLAYLRWLGDMRPKLQRRKPELQTRVDFLQTVWYETLARPPEKKKNRDAPTGVKTPTLREWRSRGNDAFQGKIPKKSQPDKA
jgi:hypothetical protein